MGGWIRKAGKATRALVLGVAGLASIFVGSALTSFASAAEVASQGTPNGPYSTELFAYRAGADCDRNDLNAPQRASCADMKDRLALMVEPVESYFPSSEKDYSRAGAASIVAMDRFIRAENEIRGAESALMGAHFYIRAGIPEIAERLLDVAETQIGVSPDCSEVRSICLRLEVLRGHLAYLGGNPSVGGKHLATALSYSLEYGPERGRVLASQSFLEWEYGDKPRALDLRFLAAEEMEEADDSYEAMSSYLAYALNVRECIEDGMLSICREDVLRRGVEAAQRSLKIARDLRAETGWFDSKLLSLWMASRYAENLEQELAQALTDDRSQHASGVVEQRMDEEAF